MNLAKMIKTLQTEMYKTRTDSELESFLNVIIDHLCRDNFEVKEIVLDPYYNDYIYDSQNHQWNDDKLTYKQREHAQKQAIINLNIIRKKLKKFGFKCGVHVHQTSKTEYGTIFYNPLLIIKL